MTSLPQFSLDAKSTVRSTVRSGMFTVKSHCQNPIVIGFLAVVALTGEMNIQSFGSKPHWLPSGVGEARGGATQHNVGLLPSTL
jgi:hypothetical protein